MATTTIYLSSHTYVSSRAQSADNTGVTNPRTSRAFYLATKDNYSSWDSAASSGVYADGALLRFTRPNALKYSKITSATLHLVLDGTYNGSSQIYNRWYMAKYDTSNALSAISWSNFRTAGILGDWTTGGTNAMVSSPYSYDISITSLFNGDLSATDFTLCIAAGDIITNPSYLETHIVSASTYLTVTYEAGTQPAPTPLYPKDVTLVESASTLFSWQFNSETEATQTAAELQYKLASAQSYTTVSLTQTGYSYTLNQTLAAGAYQWRVKVTNDAGTTSNYSEVANFNIVGKPASPIINEPANKALTMLSWNTTNQQSCELILKDQSGRELVHETIATNDATYKPNIFLKGQYLFSVRVMNDSMLWSDWAERAFTISAAGPSAATIALTAAAGAPAVHLSYTIPEGANAALMRSRGGIEKVVAQLGEYSEDHVDDTVAADQTYTYWIRTYINGYTDSQKVTTSVHYEGAILSTDETDLHLTRSDEQFLPHSESITRAFSVMNFSGREYPMIERGEFTTIEINRRFYVSPADKRILDGLCKEERIFYRDTKGNAFPAAIRSVSYDAYMGDGYLATIDLIRLNEEEVVVNV